MCDKMLGIWLPFLEYLLLHYELRPIGLLEFGITLWPIGFQFSRSYSAEETPKHPETSGNLPILFGHLVCFIRYGTCYGRSLK